MLALIFKAATGGTTVTLLASPDDLYAALDALVGPEHSAYVNDACQVVYDAAHPYYGEDYGAYLGSYTLAPLTVGVPLPVA